LRPIKSPEEQLGRIVMLFRELRDGKTLNGKTKLKASSGSLSTAEAISVGVSAWAEAAHFGRGTVEASHMAANLVGAVVKDPVQDLVALQEYVENVLRTRDGWDDLYRAIREVI
jgi:predicted ATPase